MSDYNVYYMGPDFVVASSIPDALDVLCEHRGVDEDARDDYLDDGFDQVSDDTELSIICDESGRISVIGEPVARTARDWADREGRGFLSSTEF